MAKAGNKNLLESFKFVCKFEKDDSTINFDSEEHIQRLRKNYISAMSNHGYTYISDAEVINVGQK